MVHVLFMVERMKCRGSLKRSLPDLERTGNNLKPDIVKESSHTESNVKKYKDVHCKLREFFKEASILKRYGTKTKCGVFLKMKQ